MSVSLACWRVRCQALLRPLATRSCIRRWQARLGFALVSNPPFVDGNKRIGVFAMLIFLQINGAKLTAVNDDVIRLGLGAASGAMRYEDMLTWVHTYCGV